MWAASEALAFGQGGVNVLYQVTGLSASTIYLGIKELQEGVLDENTERIRQKGAGRKSIEKEFPDLVTEVPPFLRKALAI